MNEATIYDRLIEARKEAGLSTKQVDIAAEVGIAPPSVNRWAKDGGNMRLDHAVTLANSAGVAVEWLLTGRAPRKSFRPNSLEGRLHSRIERLPRQKLETLLQFADFLSSGDTNV